MFYNENRLESEKAHFNYIISNNNGKVEKLIRFIR